MHRVGIVLILFCSVLLLPFSSGQASAEDKAIAIADHPDLVRWRAA